MPRQKYTTIRLDICVVLHLHALVQVLHQCIVLVGRERAECIGYVGRLGRGEDKEDGGRREGLW